MNHRADASTSSPTIVVRSMRLCTLTDPCTCYLAIYRELVNPRVCTPREILCLLFTFAPLLTAGSTPPMAPLREGSRGQGPLSDLGALSWSASGCLSCRRRNRTQPQQSKIFSEGFTEISDSSHKQTGSLRTTVDSVATSSFFDDMRGCHCQCQYMFRAGRHEGTAAMNGYQLYLLLSSCDLGAFSSP